MMPRRLMSVADAERDRTALRAGILLVRNAVRIIAAFVDSIESEQLMMSMLLHEGGMRIALSLPRTSTDRNSASPHRRSRIEEESAHMHAFARIHRYIYMHMHCHVTMTLRRV
jgi:hypothetical protein